MFQEMKTFPHRKWRSKRDCRLSQLPPDVQRAWRKALRKNRLRDPGQKMVCPHKEPVQGVVTIHDPCAVRFEETVHSAIRHLVTNQGLTSRRCLIIGKGPFAVEREDLWNASPLISQRAWGAARKEEANGRRMITYCAGCTNHLNGITPTSHVLDLLFEPKATLAGRARSLRPRSPILTG